MAKRVTRRNAMERIAEEMDKREAFKLLLRTFYEKHGFVPKQYAIDWDRTKDEPHWRKDPKVMAKLRKTARQMAKNENAKRVQLEAAKASGGNPVAGVPT
jgi:hypothetical protein